MRDVLLLAAGVDHQEKALLIPAGDDEIVQHAALFVGEQGIGLAVDPQAMDIHGHQFFQHGGSALTLDQHLPHVGNVEQPRGSPGVQVLPDNAAGVLYRHVVAGKGHHFGAQFPVQCIQRGGQQGHGALLGRCGRCRRGVTLTRAHQRRKAGA